MIRSAVTTVSLGAMLAILATAQSSPFTISNGSSTVHVFPTIIIHTAAPPPTGPLIYHGGPVMTATNTYAIFWVPPTLQNGKATSMSAAYQTIQKNVLADYAGHGIDNNNTQYYQGSTSKKYIQNSGQLAGSFVDTSAYPASGCNDPATPGNCITDAQLQTEIERVMTLKGWSGGLGKMFLVFTSSGEGSCMGGAQCAYTTYCAYHGFFTNSSAQTVIYSNEPYGNTAVCQAPGTPSPNGNPVADAASTAATHELTEAITDPLLNAW